jgi:hypothetical protein
LTGLGSDSTGSGQSAPQDRSDESQKEAGDDSDQESHESSSSDEESDSDVEEIPEISVTGSGSGIIQKSE